MALNAKYNSLLGGQEGQEGNVLDSDKSRSKSGANKQPNLPGVIANYEQSWYKRIGNVGAGNNAPDGKNSGINLAGTILSGGILGSYGISREGTLNREIDRIVAEKSGKDFNSTLRLTDVFAKTSDKLSFLTARVDACDQLDADVDTLLTQNKQSLALYEKMRKAINPGVIGQMREKISNAWERAKDSMYEHKTETAVGGMATVGAAAVIGPMPIMSGVATGIGAGASGLGTLAGYAGSGLMALGSAAIANPLIAIPVAAGLAVVVAHRIVRDKKSFQARIDSLQKMRGSIAAIRAQTAEKRAAMIAKVNKKYGPEITVEKSMRELIRLRCQNHPALIEQFDQALQEANPKDALAKFVAALKATTPPPFNDDIELHTIERYCQTLGNTRAKNMREITESLLGDKKAKGPGDIANMIRHMHEVGSLVGIGGKKITIKNGGENDQFTVLDVKKDGDSLVLALRNTKKDKGKVAIEVKGTGAKTEVKYIKPSHTLAEIQADLKDIDSNIKPDDTKGRHLLANARATFLSLADYKELSKKLGNKAPKLLRKIADGKEEVIKEEPIKEEFEMSLSK